MAVELLERWAPFVRTRSWRVWEKSPADHEDMVQEVHTRLWKELINPAERFWEMNFIHSLRLLCHDVETRLHARRIELNPPASAELSLFYQHAGILPADTSPGIKRIPRGELRTWIN